MHNITKQVAISSKEIHRVNALVIVKVMTLVINSVNICICLETY